MPALFCRDKDKDGKREGKGKAAEAPAPSVPHDPHDLSGVWRRSGGVLTMSNETPPMTAWGKARFDAAKPVYGPRAFRRRIGQRSDEHLRPAGNAAQHLFLEVSIYPEESCRLPTASIQFFEWAHSYRVIWTDGRQTSQRIRIRSGWAIPSGKWDGDTFVVKSLGFDERTWLDHFGNPVSEDMTFEERYHRVDRDTLEAQHDDQRAQGIHQAVGEREEDLPAGAGEYRASGTLLRAQRRAAVQPAGSGSRLGNHQEIISPVGLFRTAPYCLGGAGGDG